MTFFLDQGVRDDLAHWLRHRRHGVTRLRDVLPTTPTDSEAWEWARSHRAVFVSYNVATTCSRCGRKTNTRAL